MLLMRMSTTLMLLAPAASLKRNVSVWVNALPEPGSTDGRAVGRMACPIFGPADSANHTAPSGPAVIMNGPLADVGIENSSISPAVVIRPIWLPPSSVNQSAPSAPAVMLKGLLDAVGIIYSVTTPATVTLPILLAACSVNQRAPSGPA